MSEDIIHDFFSNVKRKNKTNYNTITMDFHLTFYLSEFYRLERWYHQGNKTKMIDDRLNQLARVIKNHTFKHIKSEKSEEKENVIIIPVLSHTQTIEKIHNGIYNVPFKEKTTISEKHWTLAIIYPKQYRIEFYDSLKISSLSKFWKDVFTVWFKCDIMKKAFDLDIEKDITFKTLSNESIHQHGSVNCVYFTCLYVHLFYFNKTMSEIDNDKKCSEEYIKNKYEKFVKKFIN